MIPADLAGELPALASRLRSIAAKVDIAGAVIEREGNSRETEAAMRGIVGEVRDALQHAKSLTGLLYLLNRTK